jgi:hypothetical protein
MTLCPSASRGKESALKLVSGRVTIRYLIGIIAVVSVLASCVGCGPRVDPNDYKPSTTPDPEKIENGCKTPIDPNNPGDRGRG